MKHCSVIARHPWTTANKLIDPALLSYNTDSGDFKVTQAVSPCDVVVFLL